MKNLFGDNRQANILSVLRKNSALNIEMLAQRFGVSERTVRNDIKDINRELKNSGLVEINQGKCSLRVFDTRDFQNAYARIIETDDLKTLHRRGRSMFCEAYEGNGTSAYR